VLLQVITGTTRQGRFSERVAAWALGRLHEHGGFDVESIDLRDHPLPFFDAEMAPARAGGVYEHDAVSRFGDTIARADGFVVLTGEYNHGYPAVLKNAMDSTFVEWRRKPISFVGWGNVGGARAIEQLRQVAVEFEMAPLRLGGPHPARRADRVAPIRGPRRPLVVGAPRSAPGHARRRHGVVDAGARDGPGRRRVDRLCAGARRARQKHASQERAREKEEPWMNRWAPCGRRWRGWASW